VSDSPAPVASPTPSGGAPAAYDRRAVYSWAVYDLANTVFYAIVVTAFFPVWFDKRYGGLTPFGVTTSVTLLVSGVVSPWMGSRVDRSGRARPGLDAFTLVCVAATVALCFTAPTGEFAALATYAVALFAYQSALTFYNALLPVVAPPDRRGFVSALGTGLGYIGVPAALLLGKVVMDGSMGVPGTFLVAGGMFLLGTVPLWLFVRDRPRALLPPAPATAPGDGIVAVFRRIASDRRLLLLLVANFVCADVANTLIGYAAAYFENGAGYSQGTAIDLLVALAVTACVGGLVIGRFADRVPPTLLYVGCCAALVVGLVGAALAPGTSWATAVLVLTGGVGVSAIWSLGRQMVLRLSPPERFGEALGVYGITVKMSIVGTSVFAFLVDRHGYRTAILVEAACLAVGCGLILSLHRAIARGARA
jgi:MFS transporter, UMF1 family